MAMPLMPLMHPRFTKCYRFGLDAQTPIVSHSANASDVGPRIVSICTLWIPIPNSQKNFQFPVANPQILALLFGTPLSKWSP